MAPRTAGGPSTSPQVPKAKDVSCSPGGPSPWARLHLPPISGAVPFPPSSHARAWRPPPPSTPQHYPRTLPQPQPRSGKGLLCLTRVFSVVKMLFAGFLSSSVSSFPSTPTSSSSSLSLSCCLRPLSSECCSVAMASLSFFFLVLRRDILTVDNVKAESEEEPRGGLEAGLSETVCGPRVQADSGPGAAGGGGDSSGVHLKNTTYPRGPLSACGCSEQTPPQFLLACPPGLSLPLWLRVAFP